MTNYRQIIKNIPDCDNHISSKSYIIADKEEQYTKSVGKVVIA